MVEFEDDESREECSRQTFSEQFLIEMTHFKGFFRDIFDDEIANLARPSRIGAGRVLRGEEAESPMRFVDLVRHLEDPAEIPGIPVGRRKEAPYLQDALCSLVGIPYDPVPGGRGGGLRLPG